jgi:ABC-type uncharacterized transport system permease subunit
MKLTQWSEELLVCTKEMFYRARFKSGFVSEIHHSESVETEVLFMDTHQLAGWNWDTFAAMFFPLLSSRQLSN